MAQDFEAAFASGELPGEVGDDGVELGGEGGEIGGRRDGRKGCILVHAKPQSRKGVVPAASAKRSSLAGMGYAGGWNRLRRKIGRRLFAASRLRAR